VAFLKPQVPKKRHRLGGKTLGWANFEIDEVPARRQNRSMGQAERSTCPGCGAFLILALPAGGKGRRTFQCFECERPDPLKTETSTGRLKSELRPPK
jgi:hypothetical protein